MGKDDPNGGLEAPAVRPPGDVVGDLLGVAGQDDLGDEPA